MKHLPKTKKQPRQEVQARQRERAKATKVAAARRKAEKADARLHYSRADKFCWYDGDVVFDEDENGSR